jgi:hypothetical protein
VTENLLRDKSRPAEKNSARTRESQPVFWENESGTSEVLAKFSERGQRGRARVLTDWPKPRSQRWAFRRQKKLKSFLKADAELLKLREAVFRRKDF